MATDIEIINALDNIGSVWGVARSGIVVSLTGGRVGTWNWNQSRLLVNPEDDNFKKAFRELSKRGILVREPTKRSKENAADEDSIASVLRVMPFTKASPGELDFALKEIGYFVIETNLS
jgi:hypothetical protein